MKDMTREEWEKDKRTLSVDELKDLLPTRFSEKLRDYCVPGEITKAINESYRLYRRLLEELKAPVNDPDQIWYELKRVHTIKRALRNNKDRISARICAESYDACQLHDELPTVYLLVERYKSKLDQLIQELIAEKALTPVDDTAWEEELEFRRKIKRWEQESPGGGNTGTGLLQN